MNKVKNVILFSTRKINEKGVGLFSKLEKNKELNPSLCSFFLNEYKEILTGIKQKTNPDETNSDNWEERAKTLLTKNGARNFNGKDLCKLLEAYKAGMTEDDLNECESLLKSHPQIDFCLDDFDKVKDHNNTLNLDSTNNNLKLGDRVSLYSYSDSDEYALISVWPLNEAIKGEGANEREWVDALTKAVLEEKVHPNCENLILWLHDKDLNETKSSPFQVIEPIKKVNIKVNIDDKEISRRLGVFQHDDKEFTNCFEYNSVKELYDYVFALFGRIGKMIKCNENGVMENKYNEL